MQPRLALKLARHPRREEREWLVGFQVSPHLAGTGCLGTGSPTLTSSPVKVAEVCADGTRALKSLPHTSLSGLWDERGGPGAAQAEKPESFPPAGGTRG